ncbi:prolipoprotein diacylglyceryl transferase [Chloroflexota bacterium]
MSISPIAFTIGPLSIRWYGIFIALAILWLLVWMMWQRRRGVDLSYDTILTAALVGVPSGVIISRILHVIDGWSYYVQNPGQIIGASGLTAYGAILGAALGIWVYSRVSSSFKFGYFADIIAPAVAVAQAVIGRVGCTINGCCYGIETSLPWGVVYTDSESFAPLGIAVHPTTVYEIIFGFILFGVLIKLRGRLKPDGSLFLVYLSLYAMWRFGIDFIREGAPFLFGLHQAQVVSLIVLAIAIPILATRTRWAKRKVSTELH